MSATQTATYETYSTRKKGAREVRFLRAEVGYDRANDCRLFRYGVVQRYGQEVADVLVALKQDAVDTDARWQAAIDALGGTSG